MSQQLLLQLELELERAAPLSCALCTSKSERWPGIREGEKARDYQVGRNVRELYECARVSKCSIVRQTTE